jgi:UDP-N-acetyl-D-mannosaminuronic acid dehydrogenase
MRPANNILVNENQNLGQALQILEKASTKLLICINNKKKFLGVISDGDIRRAILKKKQITLFSKITLIINKKSTTVNENANISDAQNLLTTRVSILPVINSNQKVVGYYSLEDTIKNFNKKITIVGLGYVGLTLSLSLSKNGFEVRGFDKNKKLIESLKKGKLYFYENNLQNILNNERKNIIFSDRLEKCLSDCYIITVGTPLKSGKANLKYIKSSIKDTCKVLKRGDLLIFRSTLPILTTNKFIIPLIFKYKKFKAGEDYFISFAPERTIEGNAINELENNPQIIGADDLLSFEKTSIIFNKITKSIIKVDDIKSAEFAKLIDNSYRDHRFAFSNQLIEPCERLKINLPSIIKAVNFGYGRNDIATPSPGVGGPCLTKDPYIFSNSLGLNLKKSLISKIRSTNKNVINHIFIKCNKIFKKIHIKNKNVKIFFLGLAFKGSPETSDIRGSTSLDIIKKFKDYKNIFCYDPILSKNEIKNLGLRYQNINNGFKNATLIIFLNNHKKFEKLNLENLSKKMRKPGVIIDTWNVFDQKKMKQIKGLIYSGLGND